MSSKTNNWNLCTVKNLDHLNGARLSKKLTSKDYDYAGLTNNQIFFKHCNKYGKNANKLYDPKQTNNAISKHQFSNKINNTINNHSIKYVKQYEMMNFKENELHFTNEYFLEKIRHKIKIGFGKNNNLDNTKHV